jgi:hypothetical protein
MPRDRLGLALIIVGIVLVAGGVPLVWVGLAATAVGAAVYAEARRRESLPTFSILLGVVSILFVLTIWLFVLAIPAAAAGLLLAWFARPGRSRIVGVVLNGLAFVPSAALVIWLALT